MAIGTYKPDDEAATSNATSVKMVFIASPKEHGELESLQDHLRPLYRRGGLEAWTRPRPGDDVDDWWQHHCRRADVFVVLMSSGMMSDDSCWGQFRDALTEMERRGATLVPLRVKAFYPDGELANLQMLPRSGLPICEVQSRDSAWTEIVGEIDTLVRRIQASRGRPDARVLAVGVDRYRDPSLKLAFAAKDAREFVAVWESQRNVLYREVSTSILLDDEATKEHILAELHKLSANAGAEDVTVIFLSGSGRQTGDGYRYILHDFDRASDTGAVRGAEIWDAVREISGWRLIFVDTCSAGRLVEDLRDRAGRMAVFAATNVEENALELPSEQNGAFTRALIEGLEGAADAGGTGAVTLTSLFTYTSGRVRELTHGRQSPTMAIFNATTDIMLSYAAASRVRKS